MVSYLFHIVFIFFFCPNSCSYFFSYWFSYCFHIFLIFENPFFGWCARPNAITAMPIAGAVVIAVAATRPKITKKEQRQEKQQGQ